MKLHTHRIHRLWHAITAFLAGFCLLSLLFSLLIHATLMNGNNHTRLLKTSGIYQEAYISLKASLNDLLKNIQEKSPKSYAHQKPVFDALRKSLTPGLVEERLHSLTHELFQYFHGERNKLPDIRLDPETASEVSASPESTETIKTAAKALSKMNSINAGTLLNYSNRGYVADKLEIIRLFFFGMDSLSVFSLLAFLLFVVLGYWSQPASKSMQQWWRKCLLTTGILWMSFGVLIMLYAQFGIPYSIFLLQLSFPLQVPIWTAYLRDLLLPVWVISIVGGLGFILTASFTAYIPSHFPMFALRWLREFFQTSRLAIKRRTAFLFIIVLLSGTVFWEFNQIHSQMKDRGITTVWAALRGINTSTQVVPASTDSIFILEVRLMDEATGSPISDVDLRIARRVDNAYEAPQYRGVADRDGTYRVQLEKGSYYITFGNARLPEGYHQPSPVFLELKTPGTTIVTAKLQNLLLEEIKSPNYTILNP